ncbi:MAG: agmatinase family protein [Planctomycetota bacterium]
MPQNFLGLPARYSDYPRARFAVLPIPYDSTTSFQTGTREGPAAIIRASQQVELFDEELEAECHRAGVATLDPLMPNMAGPKAMHEDVFVAAKRIVRDGKFLFGLGGEHSITSGLVRAVMTKHKKLSVLQIDAHLDLRDSWEGSPHSHACVMRRCLELGAKIVPVGIRNVSLEEHRYLRTVIRAPSASEGPNEGRSSKFKVQKRSRRTASPGRSSDFGLRTSNFRPSPVAVVTARQCHTDDDWVDRVLNALGETVYITIDIDGFDPSFAPGTGTPEPGGLDWYQVTGLLRLVAAEKTVVGADIVEVMPLPGQAVTEFLAARLAYKLISYVQTRM